MTRKGSMRKEWIEALESGRYKQTKEYLARRGAKKSASYCCLGVAGRVAGLNVGELEGQENICDFPHSIREDFRRQFNTTERVEMALAFLNDDKGYTFDKIAKLLKRGNKAILAESNKEKPL